MYLGTAAGLQPTAAWSVQSNLVGTQLGHSVSTAGDVNGDGYSDVIVGAPFYDTVGNADRGQARVHGGTPTGLNSTATWTKDGDLPGEQSGYSVCTAGDVNGDGRSDVIVGSPGYSNPESEEGKASVFLGITTGVAGTAYGTAASDQAEAGQGSCVATAGDVNGDGFSDFAVSAYKWTNPQTNEGRVQVYCGAAAGPPASPCWTAEGGISNAFLGYSISAAGDVNGDGYTDFIAGAPGIGFARTAYGRNLVRIDWNAAPFSSSLPSAPVQHGLWLTTGAPVGGRGSRRNGIEVPSNLVTGRPYHWRMRVAGRSPYFPHSPWYTAPRCVPSEQQIRTPLDPAASRVWPAPADSDHLVLLGPLPNPLRGGTLLRYLLPASGRVTLTVHDASGRRLATLVDADEAAGLRSLFWDCRDGRGGWIPRGVYFVRLSAGGETYARKVVLME